jgi:pimeloyl-ACP methyl ester carboxylesterase
MPNRVLLVGWGNSTPSQLVAYERVYTPLGLATRSVIPNTRAGLADPRAFGRALAPVAAELVAEGADRPLLIHLFSDNGFIGWAAFLDALAASAEGARVKAAIRGVVYDSSPGLWNVRGPFDFARRFALGMTPAVSRLVGLGARERIPVVTPLIGVGFLAYQVAFPRAVAAMRSAGDRVARLQPSCPHLFIYGGKDVLVPPSDVRAWIARERAAGIDVEEIEIAHGRHVALYPQEPRLYRDALKRFVQKLELG